MAREGDKWRVQRGDCLWNIAKSVYGNPYKWTAIADANGVSRSTALIYPNQLLKLPGITAGTSGGGSSTPAPTPAVNKKVSIQWWQLDSGTTRQMFCAWEFSRANTGGYDIKTWYDTGAGGWRFVGDATATEKQYGCSFDESAKKCRLQVKPFGSNNSEGKRSWDDGEWVTVEYDFSNNPPLEPAVPTVELDGTKLTCSLTNIDENINADSIEFAVYKNNTIKYKTGICAINAETRFVQFETEVEIGGSYTVRCRAVRKNSIYSNWTDFSEAVKTAPNAPERITTLRPQVISEQASKTYGVFVEWTEVVNADNYEVQYTTDITYFDVSPEQVHSVTTEEGQGPRILITDIELGHQYFFRVRALNGDGESGWTPIEDTTLGTKPSPPTTWSSSSSAIVGEDFNLYWTHNSTDGSIESIARIHFTIIDAMNPEREPMEKTIIVRNEKPEEDKDKTSTYTINTNDDEWNLVKSGFTLKWKVQTAGVVEEYSDWSVEREVNVYQKPELEIDIKNQNGESIQEINGFPFYVNIFAKPAAQVPISYYIEVIANEGYETVDSVGKTYTVNPGDKIYQRFYDPTINPWEFVLEMTPGNIDLENGVSYTLNATVSMNSGLSASNTMDFTAYLDDMFYDVYADVVINEETLEASIHPYCNEFAEQEGEIKPKLSEKCVLSVYRREYDGTFTLIAEGIDNLSNIYVTDPHPSLDYARYRVTATNTETGSISYADIPIVKVGEPSIVIQWAEAWSWFESDNEGTSTVEPKWAGSMIKIPYNVDTSESAYVDMEFIEYVGRQHPVAYYGTQVGESATWNCEIPRSDTNTLYSLRRLQKYAGDVYVREPSGVGYWAAINVSFNTKHKSVTIPVTFTVKRVEGGA